MTTTRCWIGAGFLIYNLRIFAAGAAANSMVDLDSKCIPFMIPAIALGYRSNKLGVGT